MTTNQPDRIDQIETLLEQFISASVTDRQASNERMTRIEDRLGQLTENQKATDAKVGVLTTAIDTLAVEVRRVVNYLESQSGNGRHGG